MKHTEDKICNHVEHPGLHEEALLKSDQTELTGLSCCLSGGLWGQKVDFSPPARCSEAYWSCGWGCWHAHGELQTSSSARRKSAHRKPELALNPEYGSRLFFFITDKRLSCCVCVVYTLKRRRFSDCISAWNNSSSTSEPNNDGEAILFSVALISDFFNRKINIRQNFLQ